MDEIFNIAGRVWCFRHNIDTDVVIAPKYLIEPLEEMKRHTFEVICPCFASEVLAGDIIVAGKNFGCGSSREQAVQVFRALGVGAVVAKSFARIFYRNAINAGLPVIECSEPEKFEQGDLCQIVIGEHDVELKTSKYSHKAKPFPEFVLNLIVKGGQ